MFVNCVSVREWADGHCTGWRMYISPITGPRSTEGSRKLRFPGYVSVVQDGGKVVSLTHRPLLPPGNTNVTHFC